MSGTEVPGQSPSDGIPGTLKITAGLTWRVLVIVAGVVVAGYVMNVIFPVVFALFFAMLMTAWTQPLMNVFHRFLPKVLSMVLALLIIGAAVVVLICPPRRRPGPPDHGRPTSYDVGRSGGRRSTRRLPVVDTGSNRPDATAACHTRNGACPPSLGSSNTSWNTSLPPAATNGDHSS